MISILKIQSRAGRRVVWFLTAVAFIPYVVNAIGWIVHDELWQGENWEGEVLRCLAYLLLTPLLLLLLPSALGRLAEWLLTWMPISNPTVRRWAGGLGVGQVCWFLGYAIVVLLTEHRFGEDFVVEFTTELGVWWVLLPLATFLLTWLVFFAVQEVERQLEMRSVGHRRLAWFCGILGGIGVFVWLLNMMDAFSWLLSFGAILAPVTVCLLGFLSLFCLGRGIGWVIEGYRMAPSGSNDTSVAQTAEVNQARTES